ncbi:FHA domain-containing protein [Noviherbaspirillum denitrificans]|uniref:FHA domain-containing protein n=1 Tax=Noviherbaspirillum denitrificans TaxID=1968433 RepID=A0A254TAX1_9BURK|nr:FHA domain-containing protein [Noviherbaspirillum denitrificans]OWW19800.1 hypothetical protein AYR66_10090 [Noviherbaspirillum denitrificans]
MAKITLSLGDKILREVPLNKERVTIGRRPHNDLVLDDLAISGEHAVIVTLCHDSFLEDLNSTNGTKVNGQPVRKHYLRDGDCVELAHYRLLFVTHTTTSVDVSAVASIKVCNGPRAGTETALSKAITSIGKQEQRAAVILKRVDGYFLTRVDKGHTLLINGQAVGTQPHQLRDGDVIAIGDDEIQFCCVNDTQRQ